MLVRIQVPVLVFLPLGGNKIRILGVGQAKAVLLPGMPGQYGQLKGPETTVFSIVRNFVIKMIGIGGIYGVVLTLVAVGGAIALKASLTHSGTPVPTRSDRGRWPLSHHP